MGWNDGGEGEGEMREPFGLRSGKTGKRVLIEGFEDMWSEVERGR